MRVNFYYVALSLCCMLPFMALGADLEDKSPPKPPLRSTLQSIIVETRSGMLTLHFRSDLGEVSVLLHEVSGVAEHELFIDTSVQNQAIFTTPAGSYILTITDTSGNVIKQDSVVIP